MHNVLRSDKGAPKGAGRGSQAEAPFRERVREASRQFESAIILEALEKHRWNRRRTAEALQISYRLLMYKMKSCDLRNGGLTQQPSGELK